MYISMRTEDIVRLLLKEMVAVLVVQQTWSHMVGVNETCVEQKGTVCNRRPPKECSLERLEPSPEQEHSAVNPETFFHVAVLVNSSGTTLQRYLYFEWMQCTEYSDASYQSDSVTVKVTPLLKGRTLDDHVICMSSLGHDNETHPQINWPDSTSSRSRYSTMVPLPENVNTAIVEIHINSSSSQYLVQIPKYSRHAWILPGVSIVTQDSKSYISISSPDNLIKSWTDAKRIKYSVTLVCHMYSTTEQQQTVDKRPMRILSRSPVTNCSMNNKEIYLQYLPKSARPLVFVMTQLAYSIVIDAQLVTGSADQVIAETNLITPIFAHVGKTNGAGSLVSETKKPRLDVTMVQEVNNDNNHSASGLSVSGKTRGTGSLVSQNPRTEDSTVQEVNDDNKLLASELSAFTAENDETNTEDFNKITWGIIAASVSFFVAICLFATWRFVSQKNRRSVQQQGISDEPAVYESTKNTSRKLLSTTEAEGSCLGSSRMPRFRSECCTHRASDVPSNSDLSDPLISGSTSPEHWLNLVYNPKSSQLTCHGNLDSKNSLCYEDLSGHFARNNCFQIKDNANQWRYDHLPCGLTTRKQGLAQLRDDVHESDDIANFESEMNMDTATVHSKTDHIFHPPVKVSSVPNHNLHHVTDFKNGSNFMLTSIDDSMYEEDDSECEQFSEEYHVVKPQLFPDHIDPMIMKAECLKINHRYEQLTGITTDSHKSPSSENILEDDCFSISESIVC